MDEQQSNLQAGEAPTPTPAESAASVPAEATAAVPAEAAPSAVAALTPAPARAPAALEPDRASAWTIPLLCAGIAIIACCLLIPAADENRRLAYEREKLRIDLDQIKTQISVNDEFLKRVADDPNLLERLAQRQMKLVRAGTTVLELRHDPERSQLSPYLLVTLPPPAELAPYRPIGGKFSALCRQPRSQLFLMGGGMLLVATGLVMGSIGKDPASGE